MTDAIRLKARELGFNEVGFHPLRPPLRLQQQEDLGQVPSTPSASPWSRTTSRRRRCPALRRSSPTSAPTKSKARSRWTWPTTSARWATGAQVHSPNDNSGAYIPMFIEAGLEPAWRQRPAALAPLRARAPGSPSSPPTRRHLRQAGGLRASTSSAKSASVRQPLPRQGVAQGQGVVARHREVSRSSTNAAGPSWPDTRVARSASSLPRQRYGMKPVMEHYVETGEVLGKGTHNLRATPYATRDTSARANCPDSTASSSRYRTGGATSGCSSSSRRGSPPRKAWPPSKTWWLRRRPQRRYSTKATTPEGDE